MLTQIVDCDIEEALEEAHIDHQLDVERSEKRLAELRDSLPKRLEQVKRLHECAAKLRTAGFGVNPRGMRNLYLHVDLSDLPRVHAAIGKIRYESKEVASVEDRTVFINLRSVEYPDLLVSYVKKLPENGRCKIVRQHNTYDHLVCGI